MICAGGLVILIEVLSFEDMGNREKCYLELK